MSTATEQGIEVWRARRGRLRLWWWAYLIVATIGGISFVRNLNGHDPYAFAIFLLIPLIGIRQAWRTDRQIVECDKHISRPIMDHSKENL